MISTHLGASTRNRVNLNILLQVQLAQDFYAIMRIRLEPAKSTEVLLPKAAVGKLISVEHCGTFANDTLFRIRNRVTVELQCAQVLTALVVR